MKVKVVFVVVLLIIMLLGVMVYEYVNEVVYIDYFWSWLMFSGMLMGVGYLMIKNISDVDIMLVGVEIFWVGNVLIYELIMYDGMMSMQLLKGGFMVLVGEIVEFKFYGYYLMLEKLMGLLEEGEWILLILEFEGVDFIEVELMVKLFDGDVLYGYMEYFY